MNSKKKLSRKSQYNYQNDHTAVKITEVPIDSSPSPSETISVKLIPTSKTSAAAKIQSAYRSHVIRTLFRKIATVNSEANSLERLIQRQETVDAVRGDEREKIRMNEALMSLLLRLDSVPGTDPTVRELRRSVSRRIVGLQEILDSVCDSRVECEWNWDVELAEMEERICREVGGDEMERFCAEKLGFRCLQRFLRGT